MFCGKPGEAAVALLRHPARGCFSLFQLSVVEPVQLTFPAGS